MKKSLTGFNNNLIISGQLDFVSFYSKDCLKLNPKSDVQDSELFFINDTLNQNPGLNALSGEASGAVPHLATRGCKGRTMRCSETK